MRKSFAAMVLVYRQVDYLDYCLRAAVPYFDKIVCMYSDLPWTEYNLDARARFGGDDGSHEVLRRHAEASPVIHVVEGAWRSEESMRGEALALIKDWGVDFTFILDADEIYPEGTLAAVQQWIAGHEGHDRFQVRFRNLFRRMDYEIERNEATADHLWHNVCYRTQAIERFDRGRTIEIPRVRVPEKHFFWHLGYVLPDQRMLEKVHTYGHTKELPENWYREKWLAWQPETTDLSPRARVPWPRTQPIEIGDLPAVLRDHELFPRS